ncbi:uncharacterized protein [Oryza sativa Japonica Group]|uniref:KIB1-4 beta-propeller domain-containing protein n=2 Tax=Oryza TaxID=4527 RepID=A0A0E0PAR7_ORYRU|nr:uncharacterized protein LOC4336213 isoform X1 [Oryza sativa Japonica Group]KAF2934612.1 hypothetical protein DAI22_04g176000 [Oryza sativa Japonica Group]KAF2934613.1 hypothetical protein DAI22_04g176000 [Oryza sativa Japonica Group]USI00819.1 hypothetical protein [Oryza sativa Japonica Group]
MSSSSSSPRAPGDRKRCRRASGPVPRWASLPEDLVDLVASRLLAGGDLLDYVRFRAVCTSWRSGTASPRGRGVADRRFHPRRWMMLPEGHGLYPGHPSLRGYARFLNLDTGTLVRARIPLLRDGYVAIDSVDGLLLLLLDPDPNQEGAVRLLHPFTGDTAELPPLGTVLPHLGSRLLDCPAPYRIRSLARVVCASVSCSATGAGAGAITVLLALSVVSRVAFATSLDRQWSLSTYECVILSSPIASHGKIYLMHTDRSCGEKMHQILRIDHPPAAAQDGSGSGAGRALQEPKLVATIPARKLDHFQGLVECGSEILVLGYKNWSTSRISVFKLADLVLQRFMPIKSIGGHTLFIGERNISVSSKILPTVKGDNLVYLNSGLVKYHLSSGSLSLAIDNCSLYGRAPGPSSLVHYIYSCCIRNRWSRGLICRKDAPEWLVQD